MAELAQGSKPNQRNPDQSAAPEQQAKAPSTGESRQEARRNLMREARQTQQARTEPTMAPDPRAEQVLKLQDTFQRDAVNGSSPEQRARLSTSLKTSQDLLAQHQQVNEQIKTLGPNADPATLQELQVRAELLLKQSAATLLHANTERTIDGIEKRQERLSQRVDNLQKEIQELEKLDERDPRRLAGILEVKKDQLQSLGETATALEIMKSSLSSSLATSDSFLKRAAELSKEQPISAAHLAEANANIDSGLLVLEDADRKTSLEAIDTGLQRLEEAQRQEIERREAFAQNIARYDQQEHRLQDASKASIRRAQSNINDARQATEDITTVNSSWNPFQDFASWATGTTSAMEASRDNFLSTADEQNTATGQLLEELKSVNRSREEYIKWTRAGFEAERQGNIQKAQALFNQAALINQATADLANPESISQTLTKPSKSWQQRNREVTRQLDAAVASANTWETSLEVVRTVTVVAGATVATIATAGAGAGIFLSFAGGSAGGIAVGSLSNATEQVTGFATGLKTGEEARADFERRFSEDALTSIQSAGATATGLGAGRVFQSSSLAGKLSTTVARPLTGAIGGSASGTTTTAFDTAQTLYRRNEAIAEFNRSPEFQGLSPEARREALDARLSELGLGLDDLALRGIVNIGSGAVGGGIGAKTGALRDGAKTTLGKLSTIVVDTGADITLGLGATILTDGTISFDQALAQNLQSIVVGNALSSLPPRRMGAVTTSAQPEKPRVNYLQDAESLRTRFVEESISELRRENGRAPTAQEVAQIKAESRLVRAYENPHTGEINVLKIDTDSMSRMERVIHASDIVHELAHRRGGDEAIAHKAQFEYLLKNGYQAEIVGGQLKIRELESGNPGSMPTNEQIAEFVGRRYNSEETLGGMRLKVENSQEVSVEVDTVNWDSKLIQKISEYYASANLGDIRRNLADSDRLTRQDVLRAIKGWVEDGQKMNLLLRQDSELQEALANTDFERIDQILNKYLDKEADDLVGHVDNIQTLAALPVIEIRPVEPGFLFRGQGKQHPLPTDNSSTTLLELTATSINGVNSMYQRGGETLAIYVDNNNPVRGIPIPDKWSEAGISREELQGLGESFLTDEMQRNIGGYSSPNHELLLKPGTSLQVCPWSVEINGEKYRPVVAGDAEVTAEKWKEIESTLKRSIPRQ